MAPTDVREMTNTVTDTVPRCTETIYEYEGDFSQCRGQPGHDGPHWSGSWRWTKPESCIFDHDVIYEPHFQPEEWHLDSHEPATMAALRGVQRELTALNEQMGMPKSLQGHVLSHVVRPITGLQLGLDRLLTHLGLPAVSAEEIDVALGVSSDTDDPDDD